MSIIAPDIERERLLTRVYGIAVRASQYKRNRTGSNSGETAEDFAHEFVARLLASGKANELASMPECELVNLIFRGIRSAYRNTARYKASHPARSFSDHESSCDIDPVCTVNAAAELDRAEQVEQVRAALSQLDKTDAALLLARFADGMSLDSLSKQFGIQRASIVGRLKTATERLRFLLTGTERPRADDELVTLKEAVRMMQVGPRNIQKWATRGIIQRFGGERYGRYSRRQLQLVRVSRQHQHSRRFLTGTATR